MKLGAEDRKKLIIAGVAGVGALAAIIYMYGQLFPSAPAPGPQATQVALSTPAPRPGASGTSPNSAKVLGTTAAALDPTLHMGAMLLTESLAYHGTGRNIFSASAASVSIPKPIRPARPVLASAAAIVPTGPPPPPRIDLRFFGTATRVGQPMRAFLLRGDDVVLASVGDIVQRRYKLLSITASSVTVQDLTNDRQQMLPLVQN